jgi:hypothetical protein
MRVEKLKNPRLIIDVGLIVVIIGCNLIKPRPSLVREASSHEGGVNG